MEKGYALFVVKPTSNPNIIGEFQKFLQARRYRILDEVSVQLTQQQVVNNFFGILQANVDYLTRGYMYAMWCHVEADDVSDYVYRTKMLFREKYGVKKMQLVNLVHSSDDGLEMMLQKKLFFPQYIDSQYARGCDMYLNISSFNNPQDVKSALGEGIESIYVIIDSQKDYDISTILKKNYRVSIITREKYKFLDQQTGFLLHYFNGSCEKVIIDYPKIAVTNDQLHQWSIIQDYALYYNRVKEFYFRHFDFYQKELISKGIRVEGVLIEQGNDNLLESNCRYFYAAANGLAMSAGSGSQQYIGQYYMPHSFEVDFWKG